MLIHLSLWWAIKTVWALLHMHSSEIFSPRVNSCSPLAAKWCYRMTTCYRPDTWTRFLFIRQASACTREQICSSCVGLWAGFYKVIRWCLTHDFDQTVQRVCATSTGTWTASEWVCVSSCVCIITSKPVSLKYTQRHVLAAHVQSDMMAVTEQTLLKESTTTCDYLLKIIMWKQRIF